MIENKNEVEVVESEQPDIEILPDGKDVNIDLDQNSKPTSDKKKKEKKPKDIVLVNKKYTRIMFISYIVVFALIALALILLCCGFFINMAQPARLGLMIVGAIFLLAAIILFITVFILSKTKGKLTVTDEMLQTMTDEEILNL